jgi:HSP20 family protein
LSIAFKNDLKNRESCMDFIKIRFADRFDSAGSKFEKTFDEMFGSMSPIFTLSERSWKPQMDIYETNEEIFILAEIAGVDKDHLVVEISPKAIKISGKRLAGSTVKKARYRLAEIQYGPFERVLFLPVRIDTDNVSATCSNGFLQIRMTKSPPEIAHSIPIEDG